MEMRSGGRAIIPSDDFGFAHYGMVELNVSGIFLSDGSPKLDLRRVGFFLTWYSQILLEHGERILSAATSVFNGAGIKISVKVAGIHWHWPLRRVLPHHARCLDPRQAASPGEEERQVHKSYWMEHSKDPTVEAMMLDSRASDLDKEERPEVLSLLPPYEGQSVLEPGDKGQWPELKVRLTAMSVAISSRCSPPMRGISSSGTTATRCFTPELIETYGELSSEGKDFEVVFISRDRHEDAFNGYLSKMPWLAIPFSDSKARERLVKRFKVRGIPHLVIVDASGEVINEDGFSAVENYGSQGYPFTLEKINKLKEEEEAAKREQTLQTVLVSSSCDYLISNNGNKVMFICSG